MLAALVERGYTSVLATGADMWQDCGDFTYRGADGRLTLADFYPTEKQIAAGDGFAVLTVPDFTAAKAIAYQRGVDEGKRLSLAAERASRGDVHPDTAAMIQTARRLLEAEADRDESARRIQALQTEVWQLRAECDTARAELSRALDALSRATDWGVDMAVTSLAERIGVDRPEMEPAEVLPGIETQTEGDGEAFAD